jgi:5'-nucleotidase/UDP-sugar diphosphatase
MRLRARLTGLLLIALSTPLFAEIRTLTILHINDVHSRLSPLENGRGGFAYLAAAIRQEREGCRDCLLLSAGDLAQGSPVSTIFKAMPVFQIANRFGIDAATLGNHEFDYGWEQTRKLIAAANYPIVTSNIQDDRGHLLTGKPWVILKVNGLRIGILGAMTDELYDLAFPKHLGPWHTTPVLETARKYAAELKPHCDLIVLVAHISTMEEAAFLKEPDIHVIVTGHSHSGIEKAMETPGHVLVRDRSNGEELGRLELKVDTETKAPASWTWKKIAIEDARYTPAPDVSAQVKLWEDKVAATVDQPLAVSDREYSHAEVKTMLEDAMREATGADLAIMNPGGVRDILPKGPLKLRHAWNIMPFDDTVVYGHFKGSDLPAAMLAGHTIDPDKQYRLAVPDFIATTALRGLSFPNQGGYLRDILIDHIKKTMPAASR